MSRMSFRSSQASLASGRINIRLTVIVLMAIFITFSMIILFAGVMPVKPTVTPLTGLYYSELKQQNDRILTTYGWVNKDQGVVAVPIDRAMALVAERGLPTRPQVTAEQQQP